MVKLDDDPNASGPGAVAIADAEGEWEDVKR